MTQLARFLLLLGALLVPAMACAASGETPADALLHFVPAADIPRHCPANSIACSYPQHRPCDVWLPTARLFGDEGRFPYLGRFMKDSDAGLVAHELLHCAIGGWHP